MVGPGGSWGDVGRALLVASTWIAVARVTAEHAWRILPAPVLQALTLQSYLTVCQVTAALVGLGLAWLVLRRPLDDLGWRRASWWQLGGTALLTPAAYVVVVMLAVSLALPMLRAELLARGVERVQQSSGQFGRELRVGSLWMVLFWGVVVSPTAEELVFRGPLWTGLARLPALVVPRRTSPPADPDVPSLPLKDGLLVRGVRAAGNWIAGGGVATVITAGIFGAMHGGVPGGMGFIRVSSAVGLGLACGQARQTSGSVWAAILLHALYNFLAVGNARRWFVVEGWHKLRGVPWPLIHVAVLSLVAFVVVAGVRWGGRRSRRLE